ncbi:hypothetical protein [Teredinibacter purpureus]|uniref:hypothetical protein n=1 Tax=Teredinibacter purpureus TaxID=2731756 RepID=UPI0005F80792|nr:hypothetical protein [Teredinibacter purpureus]
MNEEYFKFKEGVVLLNLVFVIMFGWLTLTLLPSAIEDLRNFQGVEDLYISGFIVVLVWLIVSEFGYGLLLYLPSGTALELHDSHIRVCTIFGLKEIPRKAVKGCKNPVHRMTRGGKAGLVVISVSPQYRVIGPYGFKINPRFHGASVVGEDEQSIVKKIRQWRKNKNC